MRPEVYREINNFYTSTVYEKGAEVVRMLKTLLGPDNFRAGMDLYFERHDGRAATVDEFVDCFADAADYDLTQFMRCYRQAGTPEIVVQANHDAAARTCTLEITPVLPPTPGQPVKEPMVIPLAIGFLGPDGRDRPVTLAGGPTLGARRHHADEGEADLQCSAWPRRAPGDVAQSRLLGPRQADGQSA